MKPIIPDTRLRRLLAALLFCAMLLAESWYAGAVLRPSRAGAVGGAPWESFAALEPNSVDVLVFGSSHAFAGVDPATVWRERGIPTFILGGPTQMQQVTEYYMRESLVTQHPKVFALEMVSSSYSKRTFSPSFHAMNVGLMPPSVNKLAASWFATPPEMRVNVLADVWSYHGRWSELTKADFDLKRKSAQATYLKGFNPTMSSREVSSAPYVRPQSDYPVADAGLAYNREALRRIAALCSENDVELLLFLTPTAPPGAYSYYLEGAAGLLADFDNIRVLDLSVPGAVPDLSYSEDFFDPGHLNWRGAEKTSRVLADYLATTYGLPDRRTDTAYGSWAEDAVLRDEFITRRGGVPTGE
ncbi:MAG: hypothetical protein D9V44_06275 [Actinobacteria bacterium]|nr:MAG: hypothetical protein D9V44_06275 [Actinomycetota bacterium]